MKSHPSNTATASATTVKLAGSGGRLRPVVVKLTAGRDNNIYPLGVQ